MIGKRFSLTTTAVALERPNDVTTAVYIHANDVVIVTSGPLNGDLLVDVEWAGRTVMMFTSDLVNHAEPF